MKYKRKPLDYVEKSMWLYLIDNGNIIDDESYYGNSYNQTESEKIRNKLKDLVIDIDWVKTRGVCDGLESKFNGTFADELYIKYLSGQLVLKSGHMSNWHLTYSEMDFLSVMRHVHTSIEKYKGLINE